MNEERKHKKLNIKKIAVVTLSIIMIMTTFCLSAFADNPLTSKSEYIISADNLPETIITSVNSEDMMQQEILSDTYETMTIYFENGSSAEYVSLSYEPNSYITFRIGSFGIQINYEYNEETTNYDLTLYEELKIDTSKSNFSAEEQITAINEAISEILAEQDPAIREAISKYNAKEVTTPGILSTFLGIGTWIGGAVSALIGMFYLNGSLTFIGYLAVAALAVSVVFLLIYLISSFLKFRG